MRPMLTTVAGLTLVASVALAPAPAAAADARCDALPQQIRTALVKADPSAAASATRRLRVGEALCRANNARGAAREFQSALKQLGTAPATATYAGK